MRKLASIRIVKDLQPIKDKDRIELAFIDGWQVIVKKGEYKINEEIVFCEIDSVLPKKPEFDFLAKCNYRIKTMKMGGVLSQGICFPTSILPKGKYKLGQDVTDVIGIKQYEKTLDREPVVKQKYNKFIQFLLKFKVFKKIILPKPEYKNFPSFISKTDEIRLQNVLHYLQENVSWTVTEKIDGQSGTFVLKRIKPKYFWQKEKFDYMVCSRNYRLNNKTNSSYWKVSDKYNIEKALKLLIKKEDWVAIQGECIDTKVQGNKYKVSEADFYAFNLIYPKGSMTYSEMSNRLHLVGIKSVPFITEIVGRATSMEDMIALSKGQSTLNNKTLKEGIVCRALLGDKSFKVINPEFLIKYDE